MVARVKRYLADVLFLDVLAASSVLDVVMMTNRNGPEAMHES